MALRVGVVHTTRHFEQCGRLTVVDGVGGVFSSPAAVRAATAVS
jgi:hypothetical protein